jgi:hypothetical protein
VANTAIRQNEEESHIALEEARKAEEATDNERLIGIFSLFSFIDSFSFVINENLYFGATELSPPLEPYDLEANLSLKGALDVIRIANEVVDEAVNRFLNEASDKILKEDD